MVESAGCTPFRCMGTCRPTTIGFRVKRYSVLKSEISSLSSGVKLNMMVSGFPCVNFSKKINVFLN